MMMRTTITLDEDVASRLRTFMRESGFGLKAAVNSLLRLGFETQTRRQGAAPYKAPVYNLGRTNPAIDLARIHDALEYLEGPEYR